MNGNDESLPNPARRGLLGAMIASAVAGAGAFLGRESHLHGQVTIRPPGALPEGDFQAACIRCTRCADACPNECITFLPLSAGIYEVLTPVIRPRERGCILCMECTTACPTGALQPLSADPNTWVGEVDMGLARVNESLCYSFAGRTCGACVRACPLEGRALRAGIFETPIVDPTQCVGCGLCEQACIHLPQAIRVLPISRSERV